MERTFTAACSNRFHSPRLISLRLARTTAPSSLVRWLARTGFEDEAEVAGRVSSLLKRPEDARRERVERAEPEPIHRATDDRLKPLAHLARGLVGEGDREELARECPPRGEDMGKARDEHARLAGAGAGQHQHRAFHGLDRRALRGIERRKIRRRSGGHYGLDLIGHASL